jgi:hypothetical protein
MASAAVRGEPRSPAIGGLSNARLAQRGGGRRAGGLAAAQPFGREQHPELAGWLRTVVARVCLDMLRSRQSRREEPMAAPAGETVAAQG